MTTVFRSKVDGKLKAIGLAMPCLALFAIITSPRLSTGRKRSTKHALFKRGQRS
jgi:hypothetical protein